MDFWQLSWFLKMNQNAYNNYIINKYNYIIYYFWHQFLIHFSHRVLPHVCNLNALTALIITRKCLEYDVIGSNKHIQTTRVWINQRHSNQMSYTSFDISFTCSRYLINIDKQHSVDTSSPYQSVLSTVALLKKMYIALYVPIMWKLKRKCKN